MNRRDYLKAISVVSLSTSLAGCGDLDSDGDDQEDEFEPAGGCNKEVLINSIEREVEAGDTIELSPDLGREDELFIQAEEVSSARPKVELFDSEDNSLLDVGPSEEIQELYTVDEEGTYRIEFENEALLTTGTWNFIVIHRTAGCEDSTVAKLAESIPLGEEVEEEDDDFEPTGPCEEEDLIHNIGREVGAGDTIELAPDLGREDELFIQAEEVSSARPKVEVFDSDDNSLLEVGPAEEIEELYTVDEEGTYRVEFENEALFTTGEWNLRVTHRSAACDDATSNELSQSFPLDKKEQQEEDDDFEPTGPCEEEDLIHNIGREVEAGDTIELSPDLGREDELFIQAEEVSSARPKVELFDSEDNSLLDVGPSEEIQELYTVNEEGAYRIEFENEALLTTGTWNLRVTHRTATCDNATTEELSQQYTLVDDITYTEQVVEDALETYTDFDNTREIYISHSENGLTVETSSDYSTFTSVSESTLRDVTANILGEVFESDTDIYSFEVELHIPTVDEYGNEGFTRALTVKMYEETADLINWDSYNSDNLPRHAETYNLNFQLF